MVCCLAPLALLVLAAPPTVLRAREFGALGDGVTDDGPAFARMLAARRDEVTFACEPGRVYRVLSAGATPWVFDLRERRDVTLDGGGSRFLLGPEVRLLHAERCRGLTVRGLTVDYDPLPFVEGRVVAADAAAGTLDVRVADGFPLPPLGGPTREREQSYFAMLWPTAPDGRQAHQHCGVADLTAPAGERLVRLATSKAVGHVPNLARVAPGTAITLPVRGIAHRATAVPGGHTTILLDQNTDVRCGDVTLWSAPLFGWVVQRNEGEVSFRRCHVEPQPESGRRTSIWRDAFHVKGNRAHLVWEDCRLRGMNDDAFNLATHASRVERVLAPDRWVVRQVFPLVPMDFRPGDTVLVADDERGALLGRAKVVSGGEPVTDARGFAQPLTLRVAAPLPGVAAGCRLWNETSANPGAVIRGCQVAMSCRFQSPDLRLERCVFEALAWFCSEYVEGPLPVRLTAADCRFTVGRGNSTRAVVVSGRLHGPGKPCPPPPTPQIESARFERCTVDGELVCEDVARVELPGTTFVAPRGKLSTTRCGR